MVAKLMSCLTITLISSIYGLVGSASWVWVLLTEARGFVYLAEPNALIRTVELGVSIFGTAFCAFGLVWCLNQVRILSH